MLEGARCQGGAGRELPQALRRRRRRSLREEGQALVEFALILPVLLLLLLGILDFSRAMNYYNDLTQLAAEGARGAAVNHSPDGAVVTSANTLAIQQGIKAQADTNEIKNNSDFHICLGVPKAGDPKLLDTSSAPTGVGQPVMVTARMTFTLIPFIGNRIGQLTIPLVAKTTVRTEATPAYTSGSETGDTSATVCPP